MIKSVFSAIGNTIATHTRTVITGIVIAAVLGGAVYIQNLYGTINQLEKEVVHAELRADSFSAAADTTREIVSVLEDSLRYFERRAIQTELERDSLDDRLNQVSRVRADVEARVDSLERVVESGEVSDSSGTRRMEFDVYDEPFHVRAEVVSPPPPTPATMDFQVSIDPIPLHFRIGCAPGEGSVNEATVGVTTPDWAEVEVRSVTQSPNVCNPQLEEENQPGWFHRNAGKIGFVLGSVVTLGIGLAF